MTAPGGINRGKNSLAEVVIDEKDRGRSSVRLRELEIGFETEDIEISDCPDHNEHESDDNGDIIIAERLKRGDFVGIGEENQAAFTIAILPQAFQRQEHCQCQAHDTGEVG